MVLQYACELGAEGGGEVTNGAEGLVVGDEDRQVLGGSKGLGDIGELNSTQSSGEVRSAEGIGDTLGNTEDLVNDVNGTGGEVKVSSGDSRVLPQGRVEGDVAVHSLGLDALPTGDVGVGLVLEESGDELRLLGEVGGIVCAIQDVVLENGGDQASVGGSGTGARDECLEGLVAGGQNGDVLGLRESLDETRLGTEKACRKLGILVIGPLELIMDTY